MLGAEAAPAPARRAAPAAERLGAAQTDDENWMKSAPAQRLNGDVFRGTAFSWSVTAMMMTQCIPTVYPVFLFLLGWSPLATTAFFVPALLFHGLLWNALHPAMHGLPDVPSSYGLPSWVLRPWRESKLFDMLRENHAGHHVMSGRANYNVCCPGFDHILGTFTPEAEWRPQVRANTARPIEGALMASEM
jgi:sterol desaturase/sphingolipid hydroxylase (fatty acid hydroxylase superfamily)